MKPSDKLIIAISEFRHAFYELSHIWSLDKSVDIELNDFISENYPTPFESFDELSLMEWIDELLDYDTKNIWKTPIFHTSKHIESFVYTQNKQTFIISIIVLLTNFKDKYQNLSNQISLENNQNVIFKVYPYDIPFNQLKINEWVKNSIENLTDLLNRLTDWNKFYEKFNLTEQDLNDRMFSIDGEPAISFKEMIEINANALDCSILDIDTHLESFIELSNLNVGQIYKSFHSPDVERTK